MGSEKIQAENGQDLDEEDLTVEELLAEVAASVKPLRQPGDLDSKQIAKKINRTKNAARAHMDREAEKPEWDLLYVYDAEISRYRIVLRKKKPAD